MEQNPSNATFRADEAPAISAPCRIRFHSVRARLADPDGLSGKAILDGIVQAGILADDTAKQVTEVRYSQSKARKDQEEETIVYIEPQNYEPPTSGQMEIFG